MRQIWKVALLALLAGGCGGGGGEDFTVEVKRPVATVFAPFSQVDTGGAALLFPGLKINKSRPSDHELLYTIPGTGAFEATFRLTFEPARGGAATIVHVAIDVPPVRTKIDGLDKELSERKIEAAVKKLLESAGKALESGGNDSEDQSEIYLERSSFEPSELSKLLTGVAIATNSKFMDRITEFRNDPEKMAAAMAAMSGYEDFGSMGLAQSAHGQAPEAMDPGSDAREAMREQSEGQRETENDAREGSQIDQSMDY